MGVHSPTLKKHLASVPMTHAFLTILGSIEFNKGEFDKAFATYGRALAGNPNSLDALTNRATIL